MGMFDDRFQVVYHNTRITGFGVDGYHMTASSMEPGVSGLQYTVPYPVLSMESLDRFADPIIGPVDYTRVASRTLAISNPGRWYGGAGGVDNWMEERGSIHLVDVTPPALGYPHWTWTLLRTLASGLSEPRSLLFDGRRWLYCTQRRQRDWLYPGDTGYRELKRGYCSVHRIDIVTGAMEDLFAPAVGDPLYNYAINNLCNLTVDTARGYVYVQAAANAFYGLRIEIASGAVTDWFGDALETPVPMPHLGYDIARSGIAIDSTRNRLYYSNGGVAYYNLDTRENVILCSTSGYTHVPMGNDPAWVNRYVARDQCRPGCDRLYLSRYGDAVWLSGHLIYYLEAGDGTLPYVGNLGQVASWVNLIPAIDFTFADQRFGYAGDEFPGEETPGYPALAIGDAMDDLFGFQHVVQARADGRIWYQRAHMGAEDWSTPVAVTAEDDTRYAPGIAVHPNRMLECVCQDAAGTVYHKYSLDFGRTWGDG